MLGNRYQLGNEIGAGGMGTVYLGGDSQSQQMVAIKRLKSDLVLPELMERFKREGEALRELNHPNIVKLLDAIEHDGVHYLVMEYVSGGDLSDLLKNGKLPIERCLKLSLDLADALTRAHKLDIIHRDLKPANVLIAEDGTLRLTDFGVAHIGKKQRVTDTDAIVGTVDYLAPESLDGGEIDPRADIWAFGVILFEMLTGERPFQGDSIAQTLMAILTQPVPDLENLRPDAPIALVDLVYRMLQKDRNARIRSVRQVGLELEDILHGRTQQTPPATRFAADTPVVLHRPKHNLPAQTTPFVGREAELLEVAKLIENPKIRLVTILAPGGMGKTRLALEAAERHVTPPQPLPEASGRDFKDGVYFVELAPLSDPANIVLALGDAIGYSFQGDRREPKEQILDYLHDKTMLLVLDNYEHLLEGASLITDILKVAPNVHILATSRQRLSQAGETLFHLSGMDFPAWETPEDAMNYAAVKLFMNSALRAQPAFELTDHNLDAVARICRLVQGMPLGIVLAAAWLAMLSPQEIADEIQQGIDFLADEGGEVAERQRSIRAVFDYSWQQMTFDEQQVFIKLSVFRGGFTREAAQRVADANLKVLMALVNKSLIRRDTDSGRYEIHELLRQYAEEKLQLSGTMETAQTQHAAYFAEFIAPLGNTSWSASSEEDNALAVRVHIDFDNVRAAWHFHAQAKNIAGLQGLLNGIWLYLDMYSRAHEGAALLESALALFERDDGDDVAFFRGQLIARIGWFSVDTGQREKAYENLVQALHILKHYDSVDDILLATVGTAIMFYFMGRFEECLDLIIQGHDLSLASGETRWRPWLQFTRGDNYYELGRYQEALDWQESLPANLQSRRTKGMTLHQLGKHNEAKPYLLQAEQGIISFLKINSPHFFGKMLNYINLVTIRTILGDYETARTYFREGLTFATNPAYTWAILDFLAVALDLLLPETKYERAVEIYAFITNHRDVMGLTLVRIKKHEAALKTNLSDDVFNEVWERGKMLDLQTVVKQLTDEFAASEK